MARSLHWEVICVLDKKPTGQGRLMMEAHPEVQFVWAEDPFLYAKHGGRFDPETVNSFRVANFEDAIETALAEHQPDLFLINTLEASLALRNVQQRSDTLGMNRVLFYTHHENFVVPEEKRSKVFSPQYNQTLLEQASIPGIEIATQSQFNIQRMHQLGISFAHEPMVLPMPLPDVELLEPPFHSTEGVLFIGRHEPRKNPKLFARMVAQAGLPAKVLTNSRGEKKFEKTLTDAGITDFEIQHTLTGKAKADFIKSARIAFHPANLESYGFSAMETLAAGLPTLLIQEYDWWQAFEDLGVSVCPKEEVPEKLIQLYESPQLANEFEWLNSENRTRKQWAVLPYGDL